MALWLSPMESVTDLGFRTLCHKSGADLTFTEMIHAEGIVRNNPATLDLIDTYDPSVPTGLQLLVSKSDVLKQTLEIIKEKIDSKDNKFSNLQCIDLNFGCPSKEVIRSGAGPALLKRTAKMREILTTLKKYSPIKAGIKIRLGMNKQEKKQKVYLKIIDIANEIGLDYVTVHPKIASDSSIEPIDIGALKEIIAMAKIPIIGNGFVTDGKSAKKMMDLGCHAVMIARAAVGNPFIFSIIKNYLENKPSKLYLPEDYEKAWSEYKKTVLQHKTKPKFFEYNKKMFELRIKGDMSYHSPSKILQWV